MVTSPTVGRAAFWARWSWRDFRSRWVAIMAIGVVLAIGTGVYAGLGSTATWRRQSNDASFAALAMHDLQVELSQGTFVDEQSLIELASGIEDARSIDAIAERLVVDSQVDTGGNGAESVLVPARLVGMSFGSDRPVDDIWIRDGTAPGEGVVPSGVLEAKFADDRGLPTSGTLTVAGGQSVTYSGLGAIPEDFFYEGPEGTIFAQGELAILYLPLTSNQELTGQPGQVNEVVMTLRDGADRNLVEAQLAAAIAESGIGATVTTRDDADAVRVLYDDIENDQRFWNALSALVLAAAAVAAFNLVNRIVEAQRREIGIGMALGLPKSRLAIRPLLVGVQVAVIGTIAGVGVGYVIGEAFSNVLESFLPLPIYRTGFQPTVYAQAAALGFVVPIIAAALPVWRAVRVEPIEAIRTGHLTARTNRISDWTGRIPLPGSTLTRMPLRNLIRTPRRTVLTAFGVGAAITALVAVLGMLDSFGRTIEQGDDEFTAGGPDRIMVQLDTFYAVDSPVLAGIAEAPSVGRVDTGLRLPVTAFGTDRGEDLDLLVELVDLDRSRWTPTVFEGSTAGGNGGLLLARKAATDLGVRPGDTVSLRHPIRTDTGFSMTETELEVSATHANPIRTFAFGDTALASALGLQGSVNMVHVYPSAGASGSEVQRSIFDLPGVASSQPVARISEAIDEALAQTLSFFVVTAAAVMILALLIAFNATRITVEERQREHATMRAFGVPLRAIVGTVVKESVVTGITATAIGLAGGVIFIGWMLRSLATTTLPDVGMERYVSPTTILIAAAVGIAVMALAPVFLARRIATMDVPDTLRIME